MALPKLNLTIPQEGYGFADGDSVLRAALSTGPSRQRLDMLGAPYLLDLTLVLSAAQYQYWRAFYRTALSEGALPFLADLIINSPSVEEHEVKIIPGSHSLGGIQGDAHLVRMQLEVRQPVADEALNQALIDLYGIYGDYAWTILNLLDQLVNVVMPDALG